MWLRVIFLVLTVLKLLSAQNATNECNKDFNNQAYGFRRTANPTTDNRRLNDQDTTDEMMDDMIVTKEMKEQMFNENADNRRNAVTDEDYLWPDKTVRFFIDKEFSKTHRLEILKGIDLIKSKSCVKFEELKKPPGNPSFERPYLHINSVRGCYATLGAVKPKCTMSLGIGEDCVNSNVVAHEFLHSLGFRHMQCTGGRGDYIDIIWENIKKDDYSEFKEYAGTTTLFGTQYDYESIMHYSEMAFSINGQKTIITKDPKYQSVIGNQKVLSAGDIKRLNKLYKCDTGEKLKGKTPPMPFIFG